MYKTVSILDTSIATKNIGDEIIMDAVRTQTFDCMSDYRFHFIPSHEYVFKIGLSLIKSSDFGIVGGSNILSSYMNKYRQWAITVPHSYFMKNKMVTLGVGWREYQDKPNSWTKSVLRRVLSDRYIHSVRDHYTEIRLKDLGIDNVLNTSCPTMWNLTPEHNAKIPIKKAKSVLFTLSDYSKEIEYDKQLVEILLDNYTNVFFWVQSIKDYEYLNKFPSNLIRYIKVIPPNLKSYDNYLIGTDTDYVGTRLHGGIRALQHGVRTIIIGIDNRAIEKEKDFNLKVVRRENQSKELENLIQSDFKTEIRIPINKITQWKKQFNYEKT